MHARRTRRKRNGNQNETHERIFATGPKPKRKTRILYKRNIRNDDAFRTKRVFEALRRATQV